MMMSGVVLSVVRRAAAAPVNLPSRRVSRSSRGSSSYSSSSSSSRLASPFVHRHSGSVSRTRRRRRRSGSPPGSHGNVRSIAMGFSRAPCVPVRLLCAQWFLNGRGDRPAYIPRPPITISLYAPFVLHTNKNK